MYNANGYMYTFLLYKADSENIASNIEINFTDITFYFQCSS